jgi:hypothetical protein
LLESVNCHALARIGATGRGAEGRMFGEWSGKHVNSFYGLFPINLICWLSQAIPSSSEPQIPKWIVKDARLFTKFSPLSRCDPCPSDAIERFNIYLWYFCQYEKMSMLLELAACSSF